MGYINSDIFYLPTLLRRDGEASLKYLQSEPYTQHEKNNIFLAANNKLQCSPIPVFVF